MLGIGFIIAHFVAMQKPQQRKYHSSCNRSVHRGTAHRKQRVKVCKRKTPHLFLMRSFLSPCGDGTARKGLHKGGPEVFAPLRGWYCKLRKTRYSVQVFAPLRGWYFLTLRAHVTPAVFAPLTGMVRILKALLFCSVGFRPLTGMVPATINQLRQAIRFSSPCGDKLKFRKNGFTLDHVRFPSPCGAAPLYHGGGTIEIPFQGEP